MGRVDWSRRVLTVLVGIPTALKLLHSLLGMWCLASFLCALCIFEFASNIAPRIAVLGDHGSASPLRLVVLSLAVCAAACTGEKLLHDVMMQVAIVFSCCVHIATARRVDLPVVSALLLDLLALAYIVSGFGHAILLRSATRFGLGFQILGLSCAWICDSGALVAGNFLGHRKLAPVVSPGKTIVGAVAGVASSVATVVLFFRLPMASAFEGFLPRDVSLMEQLALGLVLGVLCILGDLVESLLKRVADTKDSGTFFPGHGGCLDRMDSFLFIAPALFYYSSFRFSPQ